MNDTIKFPFYAKLAFTLISLMAIVTILYYGQDIIIPVLLAGLFAILLGPVNNFLEKKLRLPHILASLVTVALFVTFIAGIIFFLSWQISDMISDWGKIKHNVNIHISNLQEVVRDNFNLSKREQNKMINQAANESGKDLLGTTLISVTDTLLNIVLLPIYIFLILLYRVHFIKFLGKLFRPEFHEKVQEIILQVKLSVQSYIVGLFIEMIIVSVLTAIGFMVIGVEYAFLLGAITGILNLIPYIGIFVAGILSIAASLTATPDISIIVGVIVVNVIVQFIDNNFLVPLIVSSKVEINALVSIVGIIVGSTIAGVAGMFLAIPIIAIMKVIFDRIDELSAWGYLMGDDIPKKFEWRKMKFQLYQTETSVSNVGESPTVIFTETTTNTENTNASDQENPKSE
ncbi:MAG TPA: AI-2E family transporter [Flavobacterium sp.]|nr:AI-2E family transporter [Flavobacterium sp.]